MLLSAPPMELGQTLDGVDSNSVLTNDERLGQIFTFGAYPKTGGPTRQKSVSTGRPITAVLLRNTSAGVLLPKQIGQLNRTAGYKMTKEVNGYSTTLGNFGVVVIDPFLPSAGVAVNDIFWGIIGGCVPVLLPLASTGHADISVNDSLVAHTGTTTGATTSGRITKVQFANATAGDTGAAFSGFNMANGYLGRAMSARTSQETTAGADILVDLAIRYFGPSL